MKKFLASLIVSLALNSVAFADDIQAVKSLTCQRLVDSKGMRAKSWDNAVALEGATLFFFRDLSSDQFFVFDQSDGMLLNATVDSGDPTTIKWSSGDGQVTVSVASSNKGEITRVSSGNKLLLSCKDY